MSAGKIPDAREADMNLGTLWLEWVSSPDGQSAADYKTLTNAIYLKNRLWHAFMAGAKAAEEIGRQG